MCFSQLTSRILCDTEGYIKQFMCCIYIHIFNFLFVSVIIIIIIMPLAITERSKACTLFALSGAGIVGSNPTQGMDVWYVYVFILCLCCPVFRQRACDELITHSRSPTVCKMIKRINNLDTIRYKGNGLSK
jgi:hypothetical protein